ncbi:amidase [Actinocorallia sp. API 0066]|uniref:amidase n=1 Tax=Actinocorallia sp. API 0066 TaxID=2896846 RepID=UPI0027E0429C|nr:amidase [Actinocorallia sp. API 0066]
MPSGVLAGVPIGVKAVEGLGAEQTRRMVAAGCVPIGLTSVPGKGTSWQTWGWTANGATRNPWCAEVTAGGSSAGSAAAVAAGIVPLATGSDGAGSVRIPAAWCGVVGLKLTTGRLAPRDRAGLTAPGPIARTVADVAAAFDALADTRTALDPFPRRLRAGWSTTLGFAHCDPEVAAVARAAAEALSDTLDLHPTPLRLTDPASTWTALRSRPSAAPAPPPVPPASPAVRADGQATPEQGAASPHPSAAPVRGVNDGRLADFFRAADVLVTPTVPYPPHGHDGPGERMNVALTWAFNLSGHPAITVPAGFTADGLPVGLQLVARHGEEATLLRVAADAERRLPWPFWRP